MPRKVYKAKYSGRFYSTREEAIKDNQSWLIAKRLQEQTDKIPVTYIGGNNNKEVRDKFWAQEPVLNHAIDSVAKLYNINPAALKYRINHEGFVDRYIQDRNFAVLKGVGNNLHRGYSILNDYVGLYEGINNFGLDDAGSMFENGDIKLKGKKWYETLDGYKYRSPQYYTYNWTNEHERITNAATGADVADNFGITAAILRNKKDKASRDFPNMSDKELDRASVIYFHRGDTGGKKYIQSGKGGYNFRNGGFIRRRLSTNGELSENKYLK